jgi:serine/threonine protein phosphatase PrpC
VLETIDRALAETGQTTAILLVVSNGRIFGASVGDSVAWLVDSVGTLDLTENQNPKPLLGSGRAVAVPFGPFEFRGRVLVGSDGLFKYARLDLIRNIAATSPVARVPDELVAAVRLPSGGLQDDIAIIVAGQQAVAADGRTSL